MDYILISLMVVTICILLLWRFFVVHSRMVQEHTERVAFLQQQQLKHLDQMCLRDSRLDAYRFVDRNLQEVLIPQSGIKL